MTRDVTSDRLADALDVRDLTVVHGDLVALQSVSLAVRSGEILGVVGPNGAGKTTLVRAVLGLLPIRAGHVRVAGRTGRPDPRDLAWVPQHATPDPLFPAVVEEVVWMGRYPHLGPWRRAGAADRTAVDAAIERTGLASLRRRSMTALSGGEQRRVVIARALAQQAPLILLDEPFAGLDAPTESDLRRVVRALAEDGVAVLLVNHDLGAVADDCDRVVLLNREVVAAGPPAEVLRPPTIAGAYGMPGIPGGAVAPGDAP